MTGILICSSLVVLVPWARSQPASLGIVILAKALPRKHSYLYFGGESVFENLIRRKSNNDNEAQEYVHIRALSKASQRSLVESTQK